jgi:hypothetical protein
VHGAVVGENLTPVGEYSSTVKNRRKCATVYRRVVVKGLKGQYVKKIKYYEIENIKELNIPKRKKIT